MTSWGWMGAAVAQSVGNILLIPTLLIGMAISSGCSESGDDCSDDHSSNNEISDSHKNHVNLEVGNNNTDESAFDKDRSKEDEAKFLHHLWDGFLVREAFSASAIMEFLSLGFPGMLQVMFEWCAFEVIALMCGILPGEEAIIGIGANVISLNIANLSNMLYLGTSVAGNVRIGNALGAGDVHRAEIACNLTLISGLIMSVINMVFLLSFRKSLPRLFTTGMPMYSYLSNSSIITFVVLTTTLYHLFSNVLAPSA